MRVDAAGVLMPEASPNFNYAPEPGQYDIWLAGKRGYM